MATMEQGEDYEEDYGFEEDDETEYEDDEAELEIATFYGIPKKYVYIGGAIILCLIIFVVIINMWGKPASGDVLEDYGEDSYVVYGDPYDISDIIGDDGEIILDSTEPEEIILDNQSTEITDYTNETAERLRAYGYTGDEIEALLNAGFSEQALIDHSLELQDKEAEDALQRMSDTAGPEYQRMMYYTYLGQDEIWNPTGDRDGIEESRSNIKINADYVKCPTNGSQLWLKCKIANDTYVWYQCSPVRWLTLPDEGNIVLDVTFWSMNGTAYVTGINESDSTLNSIDSGHPYEDIIDGNVDEEEVEEETKNDEESPSFLTE